MYVTKNGESNQTTTQQQPQLTAATKEGLRVRGSGSGHLAVEDEASARAAEGLVRGGGDDIAQVERARGLLGDHQPRDVGHVAATTPGQSKRKGSARKKVTRASISMKPEEATRIADF